MNDNLAASTPRFNELGYYALGGHVESPRDLIDECHLAERMGLGATFLSERFNVKEGPTTCGAIGAVTDNLGIALAATNFNTRHPMAFAAHATTMHRLTGGRYMPCLARGIGPQMKAFGLRSATNADLAEFVDLMKRLWRGERVESYSGRVGSFPVMQLDPRFDEDIPIGLVGFGEKTVEFAGSVFDGIILHTYICDEATARLVRLARDAAERAGRDPAKVRIWSVFATLGDHLEPQLLRKKSVGRLATYLQVYGDLLAEVNRWDTTILQRFRESAVMQEIKGWVDAVATPEQIDRIADLLPQEWLEASASGSPEQCAKKILGQFDLGVDSVILHGATPQELEPILPAYAALRPTSRFDTLPANPGKIA
ncbi:TIGR03857 family LLM class F420-dependent oxidoreductase [Novosphingobium colocasiae]|uniref:TIGR03857 family LLM class F420-dependent oxidoreductase n=1 Tax=Novosphingobium colocasiae TaxID=1256513 RepID=UPI0035AFAA61